MDGLLMSNGAKNIQCQFKSLHPDTVFQIQGLEIVLQDKERIKEMDEIKSSENHEKNRTDVWAHSSVC